MNMAAILYFFSLIICFHNPIAADDAIKPNQTLHDTGETPVSTRETLVSTGEKFQLGFFSTSNSKYRYVGIWFKDVAEKHTIVWVANRDNPLTDSSGVLKITETGNIVILRNKTESPIWYSNSSAEDPTLQLLSTGNLVVKDGNSGNYVWQSFDHPCDSLLAGMKLGWDFTSGKSWKLNSWNSLQDPSTGNFTMEVDPHGLPQIILRRGSKVQYRSGTWDGVRFGGDPPLRDNLVFISKFAYDEAHAYYTYESGDNSTNMRLWVSPTGYPQQLRWSHTSGDWVTIFSFRTDLCDDFQSCGPNSICNATGSPLCHCLSGFVPRVVKDWTKFDWTGGCVLKTRLNCGDNGRFKKFSHLKLPYGSKSVANRTVKSKEECELICKRNCSCVAYSEAEVTGCVLWFGDLLDMRVYNDGGQDLYVKMDASEFVTDSDKDGRSPVLIVSIPVISGFLLICFAGGYLICKRSRCFLISREKVTVINSNKDQDPILLEEDVELPSFSLDTIANATNNFSSTNKIGEGGFGPVYKGVLSEGKEIAVKRLSKDSGQGHLEFKNEVILISKLQHRNLVRLLGCCIHREERVLIYEFMPNKSLDLYIFNKTRDTALHWQKRFDIIVGIARGLLYLHRDSRLRIIHRDLKVSNILLDNEMNSKISDFGLARILGGDQTEVNTKRVVGTYGYMSPEYAIDGHFSVKSDVFSFGVIVLEIVSGKKNRGFDHPDHDLNLLGHAWKLWNEGRPLELIDDLIMENVPASEVLKCIQVGLLCVQKHPEERPLMSSALSMLENDNSSLPQPKQPGFYTGRAFIEIDASLSLTKPDVSNEITVTVLQGR